MSNRFVWSIVAVLSLGGLIAFLSQSSAQRAPGGRPGGAAEPGMPGMPGVPHGMPGRFVVANASSSQVLILDTATGQVYRAGEKDFKKMSDLPGMGRDGQTPARDRRPEPKVEDRPRDGRRPPSKEESPARRPEKGEDDAPPRPDEK